jgi:hypothetical protein
MILFVKEGCRFCDSFKNVLGLTTITVVEKEGSLKLDVGGFFLDPPIDFPGLPALRSDSGEFYVGKTAISEFLKIPTE